MNAGSVTTPCPQCGHDIVVPIDLQAAEEQPDPTVTEMVISPRIDQIDHPDCVA